MCSFGNWRKWAIASVLLCGVGVATLSAAPAQAGGCHPRGYGGGSGYRPSYNYGYRPSYGGYYSPPRSYPRYGYSSHYGNYNGRSYYGSSFYYNR